MLLALPVLAQTDPVARGRYLVEGIAGCGNCHTPKGPQGDLPGMNLAGGMVFAQDYGVRNDVTGDLARIRAVTAPTTDFTKPENFETNPAGKGTTRFSVNQDAFSHFQDNLSFEQEEQFKLGNALFRKIWVSSPSSTQASDGLGPLFNARSCQACHVKDGRGTVPGFDPLERSDAVALLLRLSVPAEPGSQAARLDQGEVLSLPDPVYGHQLQPFAVPGLPAEGRIRIDYTEVPVALNGGETAVLMKPEYSVEDLGYGPMHPDVRFSPRLAPPMVVPW